MSPWDSDTEREGRRPGMTEYGLLEVVFSDIPGMYRKAWYMCGFCLYKKQCPELH